MHTQYLQTVIPVFIFVTFNMICMGFPGQTFVSCGFVALVTEFIVWVDHNIQIWDSANRVSTAYGSAIVGSLLERD